MSSVESWTMEMMKRRRAAANISTCKYCGCGIRWEKTYLDDEAIVYKWMAMNLDNTPHGRCREKMGITKQYKWKKK